MPRLIAQVQLPEFRYSPYPSHEPTNKLFECPGILMDDLIKQPERVSKEAW